MKAVRQEVCHSSKIIIFKDIFLQEQQYIEVIKNMLSSSLIDQNYEVRFGAVKATCNYLMLHDKDTNLLKHFADVLIPIMNVTVESVDKQDDDACLKCLIDIAENMPKFLRPQLEQIFALCLKMLGRESIWNFSEL